MKWTEITDEEQKTQLLNILADSYCRKILEDISDVPKSAMEISAETKVPISTTYRRIQILLDSHLLSISGTISSEGKKFFLYKSKLGGVSTLFDGSQIQVQIASSTVH